MEQASSSLYHDSSGVESELSDVPSNLDANDERDMHSENEDDLASSDDYADNTSEGTKF